MVGFVGADEDLLPEGADLIHQNEVLVRGLLHHAKVRMGVVGEFQAVGAATAGLFLPGAEESLRKDPGQHPLSGPLRPVKQISMTQTPSAGCGFQRLNHPLIRLKVRKAHQSFSKR